MKNMLMEIANTEEGKQWIAVSKTTLDDAAHYRAPLQPGWIFSRQ